MAGISTPSRRKVLDWHLTYRAWCIKASMGVITWKVART